MSSKKRSAQLLPRDKRVRQFSCRLKNRFAQLLPGKSSLTPLFAYQRKRHGVVCGLVLVMYPIGRVLLELIRVDNSHDTMGLTVSQFVSLAMFLAGVAYLFVLYKFLPQRAEQ